MFGGGMRSIYGAAIFDYLLDNQIYIPYNIGISAGSANVASYVAKQKGRNMAFYEEYSFEKDYMSVRNFIKKGSYLDLDYIYGTLSNENGKNPLDFDAMMENPAEMVVVASDANTGKPIYFSKKDFQKNDYGMLKGSSCIPIACKPYKWKCYELFDGAITNPIPVEKAFEDGCSNVIVILTRPIDFRKQTKNASQFERLRKTYPNFVEKLYARCDLYNTQLENILEKYVKNRKVFVIGPKDVHGINTLKRTKENLHKLYEDGYEDGKNVEDYIKAIDK